MIKLNEEFNKVRNEFLNAVQKNESAEVQNELYAKMIDSLVEETKKEARKEAVNAIAYTAQEAKLSPKERKFFNEINTTVGYKEDTLLPQETIDRIFEDLTTQHEFLNELGLKDAGLRLKFLKSETQGTAVWGKIFGEIKGQLDAAFNEEEGISNKLTAFVVIPKDLKDFSVAWIEEFVRTQINEVFAVALELAFLSGTGKDQPIGLNRQVKEGVAVTDGVYPVKAVTGTLTFANSETTVKEIKEVYKHHSTTEKGKAVVVNGNIVMVVNPVDAWDVKAQYTSLNANGVYVTALPFNLKIVECIAQEQGVVTTFVKGRYDAYVAGGITIRKYDQTLAIEDMDLFTAKQFAYGKAKDEKSAATWTLNVTNATVPQG